MRCMSFLFVAGILFPVIAIGQQKDSVLLPFHRNVIKFNPTPMLISGNIKNITLSYERLVKPNQSFVIQLGYLGFNPSIKDSFDIIMDVKRISEFGINFSFDYRFYLLRRNQYRSPDGLYIGPYFSYYGYKFKDEVTYLHFDTTRYSNVNGSYNFFNLGAMIGYQFIFWKRFSVDLLIFGPSLTCVYSRWSTDGNVDEQDEETIISDMKDKFREKHPWLAPFVSSSGDNNTATFKMFFRYSISIGYHF
ncbi:MAG: hypothetical protein NTU98_08850 [Bacteroidetes bacterium]|nr:hypothetical protein [Bacteroidota bacterium]